MNDQMMNETSKSGIPVEAATAAALSHLRRRVASEAFQARLAVAGSVWRGEA